MQLGENKKVQDFINQLLEQIKFKMAHNEIKKEYLTHIEESTQLGMSYGLDKDKALDEALSRMGSPQHLSASLNKVHKPQFDFTIAASALILCIIGLFTLSTMDLASYQGLKIAVGLVVAAGFYFVKPNGLIKASPYLYVVTAMLLVIAHIFGPFENSQPYLILGPLKIKIVDFSVVLFLVSIAGIFHLNANKSPKRNIGLIALTIAPLIYFSQSGSLFPAYIFFGAALTIFSNYKLNWNLTAAFTTLSLIAISFANHSQAFINQGAFAALQQAEKHTDFIFYHLMSSTPGLAAVALICLGLMLTRIRMVLVQIKNSFSRSLTHLTFVLVLTSALWGVLSGLGYVPMPQTGVNFPFLSYGGSLMVANLALIGFSLGSIRRKSLQII